MSKIVTNKNAYTTRDGVACFISLSIGDFNETKDEGGFNAIVTDAAEVYIDTEIPAEDPNDPPTIEPVLTHVEELKRRKVFYKYAEIDGLFTAIGDPIEASESFSQQLNALQGRALLIVTQTTPVYGTVAADWELV